MTEESNKIRLLLESVIRGGHLSGEQASSAFEAIMSGLADPMVVSAFVAALATKGETIDEIAGASQAMRARVVPVRCPQGAIDTCGTGGDGVNTFNVSTTAALIAAAAGAVVAKHGNRSHTRVSGSVEVLEQLGVNTEASVATVERCLAEIGIGFLHARMLHPAMKHAAPIRAALGIRTIFNLLGPLANPAMVRRQIVGVPQPALTDKIAAVFRILGVDRVWVVHGSGGLCDLSISGPTRVIEVAGDQVRTFDVEPGRYGLAKAELSALAVGSADQSAQVVRHILDGEKGPCRDHALLNAGAALVVAGAAGDLGEGIDLAGQAVDSGAARQRLQQLARLSNESSGSHCSGSGKT